VWPAAPLSTAGGRAAAGFAAVLGLMLPFAPAGACSMNGGAPSLRQQLESAESVFVARVTVAREVATEEVLPPEALADLDEAERHAPVIEASYRLIERLKGEPPANGHVYDLPLAVGNCSLGLLPGWDYVFVLQPPEPDFGRHFVGHFSGTFGLGAYRSAGDPDTGELSEVRAILRSLSTESETP
jgi:hypothetical protein